ncbi:MAG: hypothetical protein ABIE55_02095 [Candidatus Aenigmatarchaeota archaeon]
MGFTVLQAVMILLISVALVSLSLPWAIETIGESMDMVEVGNIKAQFDACSDRILETARTGTNNKCFFNIDRGEIIGKTEGITYNIVSSAQICDEHDLIEIDDRKHIWQKCSATGKYRNFEMVWTFPKEIEVNATQLTGEKIMGEVNKGSIVFASEIIFRTLSVYVAFDFMPGEIGRTLDMTRASVTSDNVTLKVSMY